MKRFNVFLLVLSFLVSGLFSFAAAQTRPACRMKNIVFTRSLKNPMIDTTWNSNNPTVYETGAEHYTNIDCPSVIKVPSWIPNPKGAYYMYFANHNKTHLRLAWADSADGPWHVTSVHPLDLTDMTATDWNGHIASPYVYIDSSPQRLRMYFHADNKNPAAAGRQKAGVALNSTDGLVFTPSNEIIGNFYVAPWKYGNYYYAIGKGYSDATQAPPELYRSTDPLGGFVKRSANLTEETFMRHHYTVIKGNYLIVFFSRIGDAPERIFVSTMDLNQTWDKYVLSAPEEIARPANAKEGSAYPMTPSEEGPARAVNQLRDPLYFEDGGKTFLYYTFSGESGINRGELTYTLDTGAAIPPIQVTLTVNLGSGSGTYNSGTDVPIAANAPPAGNVFFRWTGDTAAVANTRLASTIITLPRNNVTLTATYRAAPPSFTLTVNGGSGSGTYPESTTVNIVADVAQSGRIFDRWTGDTATVASRISPSTIMLMPGKNAVVSATYKDKPAGSTCVFMESNRLVVMEAEHYTGAIAGTGAAAACNWTEVSTFTGASGTTMQAMPDSAVQVTGTIGCRLDYAINVANTGFYYIQVRMPDQPSDDNLLAMGLDDVAATASGIANTTGRWNWGSKNPIYTVNVTTKGLHTFSIWMLEDGVAVDKIILARDTAGLGLYGGTAIGPAESPCQSSGVKPSAIAISTRLRVTATGDKVIIHIPEAGKFQVRVFDIQGRQAWMRDCIAPGSGALEMPWDLFGTRFVPGAYFVCVFKDNQTATTRFMNTR